MKKLIGLMVLGVIFFIGGQWLGLLFADPVPEKPAEITSLPPEVKAPEVPQPVAPTAPAPAPKPKPKPAPPPPVKKVEEPAEAPQLSEVPVQNSEDNASGAEESGSGGTD